MFAPGYFGRGHFGGAYWPPVVGTWVPDIVHVTAQIRRHVRAEATIRRDVVGAMAFRTSVSAWGLVSVTPMPAVNTDTVVGAEASIRRSVSMVATMRRTVALEAAVRTHVVSTAGVQTTVGGQVTILRAVTTATAFRRHVTGETER